MKHVFTSVLGAFFLASTVFSQSVEEITNSTNFKALKDDLTKIQELLGQDKVTYEAVSPLESKLRGHVDAIYLDINTRLPQGHGTATPQWRSFIGELESVLEPYTSVVVEAAYRPLNEPPRNDWQLHRVSPSARLLADFLKPNTESDSILRKALQSYPRPRWEIYRKLFELRLFQESDLSDMKAIRLTIDDPHEKIKWAQEVSFYGVDEGMDLFEQLLSVPFDPTGAKNERGEPETNQSYLNYSPALKGIMNLGTKAKRLLPLVEAREKEMRDYYVANFGEEASQRFLVGFTISKMALNGISPKKRESARNGSGLLYLPGEQAKDSSPVSPDTKSMGDDSLPSNSQRKSLGHEKNSESFKSHRMTPWWVVIPLLVAFVGVLVFWARKIKGSR